MAIALHHLEPPAATLPLHGITTGAHLHFAVMKDGLPIDPLLLISAQ